MKQNNNQTWQFNIADELKKNSKGACFAGSLEKSGRIEMCQYQQNNIDQPKQIFHLAQWTCSLSKISNSGFVASCV